jgi:hypothetical protein
MQADQRPKSAYFLLAHGRAARCLASDASFSQDGQRVYLIHFDTPKLIVIDIEKQSTSEMDLGTFTGKQPIVALTLSMSGDLLFVTAHDAWAYSFQRKSCTKLCTAPESTKSSPPVTKIISARENNSLSASRIASPSGTVRCSAKRTPSGKISRAINLKCASCASPSKSSVPGIEKSGAHKQQQTFNVQRSTSNVEIGRLT